MKFSTVHLVGLFWAAPALTVAPGCGHDVLMPGMPDAPGGADISVVAPDGAAPDLAPDLFVLEKWEPRNSGVTDDLWAVWGRGKEVFAAGAGGVILHSADGLKWMVERRGTSEILYGLGGFDQGEVFAVGSSGTILRRVAGAWSPAPSLVKRRLNAVWTGEVVAEVFAVGEGGTILRSADSGRSWLVETSTTVNDLYCGVYRPSGDHFAAGKSGMMLTYPPKKLAWQAVPTSTMHDIVAAAGVFDTVFVSFGGELLTRAGTVILNDGGNALPDAPMGLFCACLLFGECSARLYLAGVSGGLSTSRNCGRTWTLRIAPGADELHRVWGPGEGSAYAVGRKGTILYFHDPNP